MKWNTEFRVPKQLDDTECRRIFLAYLDEVIGGRFVKDGKLHQWQEAHHGRDYTMPNQPWDDPAHPSNGVAIAAITLRERIQNEHLMLLCANCGCPECDHETVEYRGDKPRSCIACKGANRAERCMNYRQARSEWSKK